jgi:hypothetical protein
MASPLRTDTGHSQYDNILLPVMTHLAEELPTIEASKVILSLVHVYATK